jgi:hypothetical protein
MQPAGVKAGVFKKARTSTGWSRCLESWTPTAGQMLVAPKKGPYTFTYKVKDEDHIWFMDPVNCSKVGWINLSVWCDNCFSLLLRTAQGHYAF